MKITAGTMHFRDLNQAIRETPDSQVVVERCIGQRYIASGLAGKTITIQGTPGNALGAYLDGCRIEVEGNTQDATGDTMNDGEIVIHGSAGDATGYAMRGGKIYIEGSSGYRAGIHMKQYQDKVPVIIIGGSAGSFLGEYQAGGMIVVLGLDREGEVPVGNFCGTGMHGGKIYLRCDKAPHDLPAQVEARPATPEDLREIQPWLEEFCREFGKEYEAIAAHPFFVLTPNTRNPYKQLYTTN